MSANRLGGLMLGIAGVAVLIGPEGLKGLGAAGIGQLAVLGAALCYACAALYGRRFRQLPPLIIAAGQLTCATLLIAPAALAIDRPWTLAPRLSIWLVLLTLALACTAAAYLIYFRLLATAGATNLLLVTLLIPVGALALGAAFLAEPITPGMLAGMLLIFAGLALIDGRLLRWRRPGPTERREQPQTARRRTYDPGASSITESLPSPGRRAGTWSPDFSAFHRTQCGHQEPGCCTAPSSQSVGSGGSSSLVQ